jgi:hypothetical protein
VTVLEGANGDRPGDERRARAQPGDRTGSRRGCFDWADVRYGPPPCHPGARRGASTARVNACGMAASPNPLVVTVGCQRPGDPAVPACSRHWLSRGAPWVVRRWPVEDGVRHRPGRSPSNGRRRRGVQCGRRPVRAGVESRRTAIRRPLARCAAAHRRARDETNVSRRHRGTCCAGLPAHDDRKCHRWRDRSRGPWLDRYRHPWRDQERDRGRHRGRDEVRAWRTASSNPTRGLIATPRVARGGARYFLDLRSPTQ